MTPLDCLPHQPPLRVLDRVEDLSSTRARASFQVVAGPLMRGEELWEGALIEGLAQTAALLGASLDGGDEGPQPIRGLLVGLRRFELGRAVRLGERVDCEVELVTRLGGGVLVAGRAQVGEEVVASGRLQFVIEPIK
jgi:3-hydroxymyristoyl/3-hydroxydecanoyl-(acyl carrier protein) dehydratase